jgi:predicted nucleic acid-binding protein
MTSVAFWDASAVVKAYVDEDGTPNVKSSLAVPGVRGYVSDLVLLEVLTTFGKKRRTGSIHGRQFRRLVSAFNDNFPRRFGLMTVDSAISDDARSLAEKHYTSPASAMDLLHLAAARRLAQLHRHLPVVLVGCDQPLLDVAAREGIDTYNPEVQPHAAFRSAVRRRS